MRPALALVPALLAGCEDLTLPAVDHACDCSVRHPILWEETTELVDWPNTLQLMDPVAERYVLVERVDKADYGAPTTASGILSWWGADLSWTPPASSSVGDNRVRHHTLAGWPAVSQYGWSNGDVATVHWLAIVEMPDRFYKVQAWALRDDEAGLREGMRIAGSLVRSSPIAPLAKTGFIGLTPVLADNRGLAAAREGHETTTTADPPWERTDIPEAPEGMSVVAYASPAGPLQAWLSDDPGDGGRHPAILWAHPEHALTASMADRGTLARYHSLSPFLRPDIVLMAPTWRAEHQNPGEYGWNWGEVDDLLAARDHLAALPWVDPARITLVGVGNGAALAELAATTGDEGFRAVFGMGATLDMLELYESNPDAMADAPFDVSDPTEHVLRSPMRHVGAIAVPTWHLQGEHGGSTGEAARMAVAARREGVPFDALLVPRSHYWNAAWGFTEWLADKVVEDTDPSVPMTVSVDDRIEIEQLSWAVGSNWLDDDLVDWAWLHVTEGYATQETLLAEGLDQFSVDHDENVVTERVREAVAAAVAHERALEAGWPEVTDNDRLDAAFEALETRGVLARQHFEDCFDCAWAELERVRAHHDGVIGYAFFTWERTSQAVRTGELYLNYGGYDGHTTVEIGRLVVAALREAGLDPEWDDDPEAAILVEMDWRRRFPD